MPVLSLSNLERLVHYYHALRERLPERPPSSASSLATFSSAQLAALLDIDATQVRKDLATIGVRGAPRVGFRTEETLAAIRRTLGFDRDYKGVLIGVGQLGGALAAYPRFAHYGLRFVGLFDADREKHGQRFGRLVVQPLQRLAAAVRSRQVRLAVLAVPAFAAQEVADQAIAAGIDTLWNFAPTRLTVPERVYVRNEHISVGLGELAYALQNER